MYVVNPETGRMITVGGPTYKMLQRGKSTKIIVERSPRSKHKGTKGWAKASPRSKKQRAVVKKRCGSRCFLQPKKNKYPICTVSCKPDCRGIKSAKVRSGQFKHKSVMKLAKRMEEKFCL
jgi:hypothetical protein